MMIRINFYGLVQMEANVAPLLAAPADVQEVVVVILPGLHPRVALTNYLPLLIHHL